MELTTIFFGLIAVISFSNIILWLALLSLREDFRDQDKRIDKTIGDVNREFIKIETDYKRLHSQNSEYISSVNKKIIPDYQFEALSRRLLIIETEKEIRKDLEKNKT